MSTSLSSIRFRSPAVQHPRQCRYLVAHLGSLLNSSLSGVGQHAVFQHLQQLLGVAAQKGFGAVYISGVRRGG